MLTLYTHPSLSIVNQIELHPNSPSTKLVEFAASKGIHSTAYSLLGSTNSPLHDDETLKALAKGKGIPVSKVLEVWGLKRGESGIAQYQSGSLCHYLITHCCFTSFLTLQEPPSSPSRSLPRESKTTSRLMVSIFRMTRWPPSTVSRPGSRSVPNGCPRKSSLPTRSTMVTSCLRSDKVVFWRR